MQETKLFGVSVTKTKQVSGRKGGHEKKKKSELRNYRATMSTVLHLTRGLKELQFHFFFLHFEN